MQTEGLTNRNSRTVFFFDSGSSHMLITDNSLTLNRLTITSVTLSIAYARTLGLRLSEGHAYRVTVEAERN